MKWRLLERFELGDFILESVCMRMIAGGGGTQPSRRETLMHRQGSMAG